MRPYPLVLIVLLCISCLSASRCASPFAHAGGLSIVAYNVKSLFDAHDDGSEFPEFSVSSGRWDEARYKIRLSNLAQAVFAAQASPGPDVLCLEEIENEGVLETLRSGPLSQAHYRYAAIAPAEGGPFSNAILSRLPILAVSCHAATTTSGLVGRAILEVELDAGSSRLVILSCHWKSKSGGAEQTEDQRRENAALLRSLVQARLELDPSVELVACGDFNESPDEYLRVEKRYATALMPVEELEAAAAPQSGRGAAAGKKGEADPAALLPDRLLVASSAARAGRYGGEAVLYSPWVESGGYSYSFRGSRERLDGFLLAPGLLDSKGLRYESFAAASAAFLVDGEGSPIAWPGSGATGYSDHLPIALRLSLAAGGSQ